jgi:hypothetical protein
MTNQFQNFKTVPVSKPTPTDAGTSSVIGIGYNGQKYPEVFPKPKNTQMNAPAKNAIKEQKDTQSGYHPNMQNTPGF